MIKKITIEIKGNNIDLSLDEAKKLYQDLGELFDRDTFRYIPYYPYYPYRTYPYYDTTSVVTWATVTDTSLTPTLQQVRM